MTDEEITSKLKEVNEKLTDMPDEKNLPIKDQRLRRQWLQEKILLEDIQKARKSLDATGEIRLLSEYTLLTESNTHHPLFNYLMKIRLRSHLWW